MLSLLLHCVSVEEKLHWSFKLYDLDGNEEIDMYEMEKIVRQQSGH